MSGIRLFGVVALDRPGEEAPAAAGTELVTVRELGAVVRAAPFARVDASDSELEEYLSVIKGIFERRSIVPAPFGTVFRSGDHVQRWLDTHYIALTEGLLYVDGRCEARVHIVTSGEGKDGRKSDRGAAAADSFRSLRKLAAAALPLRSEDPHVVLSGAFLLERGRWDEFAALVAAEARRYADLRFDLTGQWPPFDFVRLELGT